MLIALTAVASLLMLSLTTSTQHLQLSSKWERKARARDAAESMLYAATALLSKDNTWAGGQMRLEPSVLGQDCRAFLTFDAGAAATEGCKVSTNNLLSDSSLAGDGVVVPRRSCHLVAVGRCFSEAVQLETFFVQPPFPTGCASKGAITLRAVRIWGQPPDKPAKIPLTPQDSVPAHVYSNQSGADALRLRPGCEIYGNAAAVGLVNVDPSSLVSGEVRNNCPPFTVPHYDLAGIYSKIEQYVGEVPYVPGEPVQNYCVLDGPLNVAGDLELDGGALAVKGDLTVGGKLKGRGFVLVTGSVTAKAGADFEGDRRLAVLAGGDLNLSGQGKNYNFNGMLYSQGNIKANDLTVLGAVVCDGKTGSETVTLEQVDVVQTTVSVEGGVGFPITFNMKNALLNEDWGAVELQSYQDPNDPKKTLLMGTLLYNGDEPKKGQVWARKDSSDTVIGLNFSPPIVTRTEGKGFLGNGAPNFDPSKTTTKPFNGTLEEVYAQSLEVLNRRGGSGQKHMSDEFKAQLQRYIRDVRDRKATDLTYRLDLNNLIPDVERARMLTWTESQPTR